MSLPTELIARVCSFLDLNDARIILVSHVGNPQVIETIKKEYLTGNLHYLLTTKELKSWEKRRSNTIAWMEHNDWRRIFHDQKAQVHTHPLLAHACCKPFYDLSASVERGILEVTEFLLQKGADVNQESIIDNLHFENCHRPLNAALTIPCVKMLEFLLSRNGIDVNYQFQRTFGNSILHFAAGDEKVSKDHLSILLSHMTPEQINATDSIGKTALHYVCWYLPESCEAKTELLLRYGANVNAFGTDYQNPLQIVQQAGLHRRRNVDEMETLLKQYGAFEIRIGP